MKDCVDEMEKFGPFPIVIGSHGRFVHKKVTQSDMSFRKIPLAAVCVEGRLEAEGDE